MAQLKTAPTRASVAAYLASIEDARKRADAKHLCQMMTRVTDSRPAMWGSALVGFGCYHYRYASGHSGSWFLTGFAPRKLQLSIYVMPGFDPFESLLVKLGKARAAKSCLYIKRLSDVDLAVLEQIIAQSVALMRDRYECD